jgi:hypothetical protein
MLAGRLLLLMGDGWAGEVCMSAGAVIKYIMLLLDESLSSQYMYGSSTLDFFLRIHRKLTRRKDYPEAYVLSFTLAPLIHISRSLSSHTVSNLISSAVRCGFRYVDQIMCLSAFPFPRISPKTPDATLVYN